MSTITIEDLKKKYIEYYTDVPVQKYAAMAISRDEDTIIRWKNGDKEFADAIQRGRASFIRKRVLVAKAEFALERLEKEVFSEKITIKEETEYDRFVRNNTINPNDPETKEIVGLTVDFLMEHFKAK